MSWFRKPWFRTKEKLKVEDMTYEQWLEEEFRPHRNNKDYLSDQFEYLKKYIDKLNGNKESPELMRQLSNRITMLELAIRSIERTKNHKGGKKTRVHGKRKTRVRQRRCKTRKTII